MFNLKICLIFFSKTRRERYVFIAGGAWDSGKNAFGIYDVYQKNLAKKNSKIFLRFLDDLPYIICIKFG